MTIPDLDDLPFELLISILTQQYQCRNPQIRDLATFLHPSYPAIPALVIHGLTATGKSSITRDVLSNLQTQHAIIDSRECITGRHLLERTLTACIDAVEAADDVEVDKTKYTRCESLNALHAHLERLLLGRDKFVLVFDGIDRQREAPALLLAALARFGDAIPNLSVVFILSMPRLAELHRTGVIHIGFPAYSREEALQIICREPLPILPKSSRSSDNRENTQSEDDTWLWTRFCAAVWDSQAKFVGRDIISFRTIAEKLWPSFVAPIVEAAYGPRDFSKLMVAKRSLFQSEDQLHDRVVPPLSAESSARTAQATHDLPYYSKYLLCAAYLASYNPPRTDPIYFMKSSERKKRRKGGGGGTSGRKATHRKISRRLLSPSPFTLERVSAIFAAILPHDVKRSVDMYTQFATLTSLRLVVKAGIGGDVLDPGAKWKVNCAWEYVLKTGRSVGCEVGDFVFEG